MEIGNYIWFFLSLYENCKNIREGNQLILVSLTIVSDAILNGISLLCQKVLELSLGFNRIPIPFGLFIFYLEKCYNYLIFFINYLWFFILINFFNIEISYIYAIINMFSEFFEDNDGVFGLDIESSKDLLCWFDSEFFLF